MRAMGRMMMMAWKALQASSNPCSFPQPLFGRRRHILWCAIGGSRPCAKTVPKSSRVHYWTHFVIRLISTLTRKPGVK